jgi:hypothetical protein
MSGIPLVMTVLEHTAAGTSLEGILYCLVAALQMVVLL